MPCPSLVVFRLRKIHNEAFSSCEDQWRIYESERGKWARRCSGGKRGRNSPPPPSPAHTLPLDPPPPQGTGVGYRWGRFCRRVNGCYQSLEKQLPTLPPPSEMHLGFEVPPTPTLNPLRKTGPLIDCSSEGREGRGSFPHNLFRSDCTLSYILSTPIGLKKLTDRFPLGKQKMISNNSIRERTVAKLHISISSCFLDFLTSYRIGTAILHADTLQYSSDFSKIMEMVSSILKIPDTSSPSSSRVISNFSKAVIWS